MVADAVTQKRTTGNRAIIFLMGIILLNGLGFTVIGPVLPFIIRAYLANPDDLGAVAGWLTAIYAACQIIASPALGLLSDRYGRRPLLLICLLGSAIGYVLFGIGGALWVLFLSRIIDGLTGGNFSILFAYIADTTEPEERGAAFGRVGAVSGVSFIVGPVIGGLVAKVSLEAPLYLAAALTLAAIVWGYFFLPESLRPEQRRGHMALSDLNPFTQFGSVFAIKRLRPLLLVGILYAFPFAVLTTNFGVLIIDSLHWDATSIGFVALIVGAMDILVQGFLFGKLVPVWGDVRLMIAGFVCQGIAYALIGLLAFVPSPVALIAGTGLFAFGSGLIEPALGGLTSRAVGAAEQGLVGGASQSLQALTRVIGPIWVGTLYTEVGHAVPYVLNIGFIVLSIITIMSATAHMPRTDSVPDSA